MLKDITGRKTNMLTAIRFSRRYQKGKFNYTMWIFKCDCGNEIEFCANDVLKGGKKSCGCLRIGMSQTKMFRAYWGMKYRCNNPKCSEYFRYGGRGIKICDEWMNGFIFFYNWAIANGYREDLEIDRIDNDGNYCPENCRWVTHQVNVNNRRDTLRLTYNGQTLSVLEWSKITGLSAALIKRRIRANKLTPHEVLNNKKWFNKPFGNPNHLFLYRLFCKF